ncbi:glycoside hydrolase family 15 protein [Tengunoibacter tsumagoiensis]|uniref:Glucan 1,3-alpha-glucosidase n=1 Tax=Tengunoibacter tsumagoiensis TaxID=2014871 RepID=A0A401ZX25_9CHLR|nr:glycoside hydrolase family 15 protein [Tengunoibacter tsumagoiensis]GCE11418.1 glucan 1,3-alpha-glucosidase [Tengunoibacter tsumagoiensis]
MPRDLPLGNGQLLINFDKNYNLRDIYWPHVGQELHTAGNVSQTGIWVDGAFAWLGALEWQRELRYEPETLATQVTLIHSGLQVQVQFRDAVDFYRPIFVRHIRVTNLANRPREVRIFFHYDWYINNDVGGNTVFYYPAAQSLVAYKESAYFLQNGQFGSQAGISSWATGIKEFNGAEGTWRDAEDGELGRNPIAQGSVDGTSALYLGTVGEQAMVEAYHWLAVGRSLTEVVELNNSLIERGAQTFLQRTANYWRSWVNKDQQRFANLAPELVLLYKQSLLILRTQIDAGGAIIAANDADVEHFSRDSYSYMWPRDGALVANALSHAGYSEITRNFYDFCNAVLTPDGYLLHKYNPDRSWGSSWHPWIDKEGQPQLPIQEDETALVLYSLWQHYDHFHDIEFVAPHYRTLITPAADFLISYREPHTHLPASSYDLWEERRGILTYTTAAVYAGLDAAARFSALFGEEALANSYRQAAEEIKAAVLVYLWDEERGHFLRMINVAKDGSISRDTTLDSSVAAVFQFGMLPASDPHIERTMQQLEQTLWAKTGVGGMARYENDYYYQVTHDLTQAQGNPWFICTLWLAQYRIAHATTLDELQQALPLLEWVRSHALLSGVMAEQVNPFTSEPLSVSPLTWSHAEFVLTIRWYLGRYQKLQASLQA